MNMLQIVVWNTQMNSKGNPNATFIKVRIEKKEVLFALEKDIYLHDSHDNRE